MKRIFGIFLLSFTMMNMQAQDSTSNNTEPMQTLVKKKGGFGGFLALDAKPSMLNGQMGLYSGGRVSMVMGGGFNLGFFGYGLASNVYSNNRDVNGQKLYYETGYGGLVLEPVLGNRKLVHLTMPIMIGVGAISERRQRFYENDFSYLDGWDGFFVFEPSLNVELNVTKIVRVSAGAGYRMVTDTKTYNNLNANMSGFTSNISIKIGWFGK